MKHFTKCSFSNLALTQARCTLGVVFPKTLQVETDGFLTPPCSPYSLLHPGYDPSFLIASCPPDISNWMFYLNSPWPNLTHILTPKPARPTVVPISVHDSPPAQLVPILDTPQSILDTPQPILDTPLALKCSQSVNPTGSALQMSTVFSTSLYPPYNHCTHSGSHYLSPG